MRIYVNSILKVEKEINANEMDLNIVVPLVPGMNRITPIAFNHQGATSYPWYLDVDCRSKTGEKPNLYLFAVGVSDYPNLPKSMQLEAPHRDVTALADYFARQKGIFYKEVYVSELVNQEVTVERIIEVLDVMPAIDDGDVAIIFLAGHGVKDADSGKFYFLTSAGSLDTFETYGLDWDLLGEKLSKIKARTILLLDACHAGAISQESMLSNEDLAARMVQAGRTGAIIFSASKGTQEALESPDLGEGHGFFTYAILETLGAERFIKRGEKEAPPMIIDGNNNGLLEFSELVDYVIHRVDELTAGYQTPFVARMELFGDFPVAKLE